MRKIKSTPHKIICISIYSFRILMQVKDKSLVFNGEKDISRGSFYFIHLMAKTMK
jgi:hypothetical protein